MSEDTDYITVEDAADILQVTPRQAHRYGSGEHPRLQTRKAGRRILYHKGDVEALAVDLGVAFRSRSKPPAPEPVAPSDLLAYIEQLQKQLNDAFLTIGRLQAQLEQRLTPEDERTLRQRLATAEREIHKYRMLLPKDADS